MNELERCREFLEPALAYSGGTHEWEDIVEGVHSMRMQLWANERGAAITEIIQYPRKKVLNAFLAGGEMDQVLEMIDSAKQWGAGQGCSSITMSGRRGWLRVLGKHGWEEQFCTMACEIL
jgi:hypothetical protein